MRTLGKILKRFFKTKKKQFWICIPLVMKSNKAKDDLISETLEFLNQSIKIK